VLNIIYGTPDVGDIKKYVNFYESKFLIKIKGYDFAGNYAELSFNVSVSKHAPEINDTVNDINLYIR
jgi:hypothetical protein